MPKAKLLNQNSARSAFSSGRMLRVSPRKLNLVAALLRGKPVEKAVVQLSFAPQRIAKEVKKLLLSAVANAENNHGLDVDRLRIVEATVGRNMMLKRLDVRGRSKTGRIMKPFSNMRIVVQEEGSE